MPNGKQLKQNLLKGVMNVVRIADSLANLTCQKPELASSFENIFAPPICTSVCSTDGRI